MFRNHIMMARILHETFQFSIFNIIHASVLIIGPIPCRPMSLSVHNVQCTMYNVINWTQNFQMVSTLSNFSACFPAFIFEYIWPVNRIVKDQVFLFTVFSKMSSGAQISVISLGRKLFKLMSSFRFWTSWEMVRELIQDNTYFEL